MRRIKGFVENRINIIISLSTLMSNKLNIVGRIEPFLFQLIDEERKREKEK